MEGLADLGFKFYDQIELACLFRVLCKPELGNAILADDLEAIIENIIQEYGEDAQDEEGSPNVGGEKMEQLMPPGKGRGGNASDAESSKSNASAAGEQRVKKKIDQMDEKTMKILYKLGLKLKKSKFSIQS